MFRLQSDVLLKWFFRSAALISGVLVLFIFGFLGLESLPVLKSTALFQFFSDPSWHPTEGSYGIWPMAAGTLAVTAGAVLLAAPLGLLAAVFCHYYAPRPMASFYRRLIEILAGVPSVVYGFWGIAVLVPLIGRFEPPGPSLCAAILILTLMILPTVALSADSALASVPLSYITGAAALGLSRWRMIWSVIFPAVRSHLFTAVLLQTGRAIGETMAVLMVCGNIVQIPKTIFDPVRTLTANIALEMAYATGDHRSSLFVSGLLLLFMVAGLVLMAEWVEQRVYAGHQK